MKHNIERFFCNTSEQVFFVKDRPKWIVLFLPPICWLDIAHFLLNSIVSVSTQNEKLVCLFVHLLDFSFWSKQRLWLRRRCPHYRCQFHQHFSNSFLIWKSYAQFSLLTACVCTERFTDLVKLKLKMVVWFKALADF